MNEQGNETVEDVETFRLRARAWIQGNLAKSTGQPMNEDDEGAVEYNRALMKVLYEGGMAGICWPREYGGQGLTPDHLRAFSEEASGYELPMMFHLPTMTILGATLLDYGTEEQKRKHIPRILSGEELWVQFLSEPSGGSDLAAVLTRATRDGDVYVLNGAKIWSSAAYRCDYALCVARTDWDAPKHAGISMLIVKVRQPGITIDQIRQVNGSMEFCQEFFDDVQIPLDNLVGEENDGWTVTSRLLQHEKLAVGGGHPLGLVLGGGDRRDQGGEDLLVRLARETARTGDPVARQAIGHGLALTIARTAIVERISRAIADGDMVPPSSAILKLFGATTDIERSELAARVVGPELAAGAGTTVAAGVAFLARQGSGLAGGSNEIQRNIISERVLSMPREPALDRGVSFKEVQRGRTGSKVSS